MAEACAWAKSKGMDFQGLLQDIYLKNGFSREVGISVVRPGKTGADEIQAMMKDFRANPPRQLGDSDVVTVKDYDTLEVRDMRAGIAAKRDRPVTSNVLQFFTEDGSKVSIRPSGTEPKIKFYIEVKAPMPTVADYDKAIALADEKIEAVKRSLKIS